MKISNQQYYPNKTQYPQNASFKGYFACPIKELHIQTGLGNESSPILRELYAKCRKYFNLVVQLRSGIVRDFEKLDFNSGGGLPDSLGYKWGQDNKIFLESGELGIFSHCRSTSYTADLAQELGLKIKPIDVPLEGGNCFFGKKPNGETFAIIGKKVTLNTRRRDIIENLGIENRNLHIISQPDFHIDLGIRPLNYPYVLVGDTKLTIDLAKKEKLNKGQIEYLKERNGLRILYDLGASFASPDKLVRELKDRGFKTIKVPGLIADNNLNFMNAIVHQEPNGDMVYITNKTHLKEQTGIDFEEIFEKYLKAKVPAIKDVLFIDGNRHIQRNLRVDGGGIHCMAAERPDFEKWNEMIKASNSV